MNRQFNRQKPIVAALDLSRRDDPVLSTARFLARKLHAPLHIVHAVRPMFSYAGAGDIVVSPYFGYEMNFNDKEEERAREKLSELSREIDEVSCQTHLVREFPSDAILAIAEEIDAGLVVAGINVKEASEGGFFAGFATGFTLASSAKTPVLLVPSESPFTLEGDLNILVADNFENEGLSALTSALRLAEELHARSLYHLHVQNLSLNEVERMIASVRDSMLHGQLPNDPELNREAYLEKLQLTTHRELKRRYEEASMRGLNATIYEPIVTYGKPAEAVHKEVLQHSVRLMVFGRHHLLHRKTFSLGRIPYRAMVENGVATLIVPELDQRVEARDAPAVGFADSFLNLAH